MTHLLQWKTHALFIFYGCTGWPGSIIAYALRAFFCDTAYEQKGLIAYAGSQDPDQTAFAQSDQGFLCLLISRIIAIMYLF